MSYPAGEPVDPLAPPTSPTPSIPGDPASPYQPRPEAYPPGQASYPPAGPPPPGAYPGAEPGYPSYPGGSLPQPPLPPSTGYVVPSTYGAPMYGAGSGYPLPGDPLVLPPEADFGAWFSKVGEIA